MATKKPSGLQIIRNGAAFRCTWTKGEKYTQQDFAFCINGGAWVPVSVTSTATVQDIAWNPLSDLYPYGALVWSVTFVVRGKANGKWSAYNSAAFSMDRPATPTVTMEPKSQEVATFYWSAYVDAADQYPFTVLEYQHQLTQDSAAPDWNVAPVQTFAYDGSVDVTEDTSVIATGSHTRWFRARSRGMAGDSDWSVAAKRVYAKPYQATVTGTRATQDDSGVNGYIAFQTQSSDDRVVDSIEAEYVIVVPAAGVSLPPGELSWTNAGGLITTSGSDAVAFSTGARLNNDTALFARVNTRHEDASYNRITLGAPKLVATGYLSDPTNLAITNIDTSTHKVTIQATNASAVEDSFLVVTYKSESESFDIAVIPHGQNSVVVQCPEWGTSDISFGVRAVVGSYTYKTRTRDSVRFYDVTEKMASKNRIWEGGDFPVAPTNVTVSATDVAGSVRVGWEWSWSGAHSAEISWADHKDAWESTDEPSTYIVSNIHASKWYIAGLETGKTWYIRVRFIGGTSDAETVSPWSPVETIDLATAPAIPILTLSKSVITRDEILTAYWSYVTMDGQPQAYAEICEATVNAGVITYGRVIEHTETAQHIDIDPKSKGWSAGQSKNLCVRVVSGAGKSSEGWSSPVTVKVASPVTALISSTSLVSDVDMDILTELPLSIVVSGAGKGGTTDVEIKRAEDFHIDKPDETEFTGYKGEIIASVSQTGDGEIEIDSGEFNDGAVYILSATVKDSVGQTAKTNDKRFIVSWEHQAVVPSASVEILDGWVAKITPDLPSEVPSGWEVAEGDTCDIYRLSADKPELIVKGAEIGEAYVDPYPAIGEYGGHRIVYRTKDGDYITEDNELAWLDLGEAEGDIVTTDNAIIDFNGNQILLKYDIDISNTWEKDFRETRYLGGSITGDWNEGVRRTGSVSTATINIVDQETVRMLRALANYAGICHIRTADGSSYPCDIQVSEDRQSDKYNVVSSFNLNIVRVDTEELDGVTYEQWIES